MIASTFRRRLQLAATGLLLVLLAGCDNQASRSLGGGYRLEQWEDGVTYYVVRSDKNDGGGVIGGAVESIGWENGRIIALRKPTWGGDAAGWMVIDVQRHAVSGPISDEERKREPELRAIAIMSPAAAWSKLRW